MTEPLWERRLRVTKAMFNPPDRSIWMHVEGFRGMDALGIKEDDTIYVFTEEEIARFQNDYDDLWRKFRKARENELRFRRTLKDLKLLMEEEG